MSTQITEYKCPSCTGPLHFSAGTGRLECEYCESSYDVAEIEALYAGKDAEAEAAFAKEERKKQAAKDVAETEWDLSGLSET